MDQVEQAKKNGLKLDVARPVVLRRPDWKVWRHPMGGLNPFRWIQLDEIKTDGIASVYIEVWNNSPNRGVKCIYRLTQ